MSKIICFKILQFFEALSEKIFHDHTGFIDKANFYSIFPSTTYHWIEMIAVPLWHNRNGFWIFILYTKCKKNK